MIATLDFVAQSLHFLFEAPLFQCAAHIDKDFVGAKGLGEIVEGAGAHGFNRALNGAERRDEQDRRVGVGFSEMTDELRSFHARHHEIRNREIEIVSFVTIERRRPVMRDFNLVTFLCE